ncbi:MAG: HEAT repeat domain-containing protein, partial [Kangiellaceae bacterium]|nr:HEAT repeat domain-containing protein [Kangiellaceae bacterium]
MSNLKTTLLILLLAIQPIVSSGQSKGNVNTVTDLRASIYEIVDSRKLDIDTFNQALNSKQSKLIIATLQGLGRIGGEAILPIIKPHFLSKQPEIRRAAVFAAGLSGSKNITKQLWLLLNDEKGEQVKQEIYLALGNLGDDDLVEKMLARLNQETDQKTRGSIFQALAAAITYIDSVSEQIGTHKNSTNVDFNALLTLFEKDDYVAFRVGYFLARVKKIENLLSPAQLQKFTTLIKDPDNKRMLARLIGKITKRRHLANRGLLSWLIEQSENEDVALASESIFAMSSLLYIPQAKIQLGKLHIHNNPLIAQTALQVLADSSLNGTEIVSLLKKQLKSSKPSMVVAAMSGLADRQKQDEMSWAVKILAHKNPFVKIRFAKIIAEKDLSGFSKVLGFLAKDPDQSVAKFAKSLIDPKSVIASDNKANTPPFAIANQAVGKRILLK